MTPSIPSLPSLPAVFREIKSGHHWCFGDPEYAELNEHFDDYRNFFLLLELRLHRDPRGFIHVMSGDEDHKGGELVTRFVVFTAVWVDALADAGQDIAASIFRDKHHLSDLPHFGGERHRRLLAQVGLQTADDLRGVLRGLERIGLIRMETQERFSVRPGFHRLLDVCQDAGRRDEPVATSEAEAASAEDTS